MGYVIVSRNLIELFTVNYSVTSNFEFKNTYHFAGFKIFNLFESSIILKKFYLNSYYQYVSQRVMIAYPINNYYEQNPIIKNKQQPSGGSKAAKPRKQLGNNILSTNPAQFVLTPDNFRYLEYKKLYNSHWLKTRG